MTPLEVINGSRGSAQSRARFAVLLATWLVSGVPGCSDRHQASEGESHFLEACLADCAGSLDCVCGVCTLPCTADPVCTDLHPSAECVAHDERAPSSSPACTREAPANAATCDLRCEDDTSCTRLSTDHRCVAGYCRAAETGDGGVAVAVPVVTDAAADGAGLDDAAVGDAGAGEPGLADAAAASQDADTPFDCLTGEEAVVVGSASVFDELDLDALRGVTTIEGGLLIGSLGEARSQLTDLTPLTCLSSVESLAIQGTARLQSLAGLERVGPLVSLSITDNDALETLDGLGATRASSPGALEIRRNAVLRSLQALAGIQGTPQLWINDNPELESLRGLEQLGGLLNADIGGNPKLENLDGLQGVGSVSEPTQIYGNMGLVSLEGFGATSTYDLIVYDNPTLETLGDLPVISLLALDAHGNSSLTHIGLPNATSVRNLSLYDNAQLSNCEAEAFANRFSQTCRCNASAGCTGCTGVCSCDGNLNGVTCDAQ